MAKTPETNGRKINRRQLLKAAGAGTAAVVALPGSASAHAVFYGCSQVCTHAPDTGRKAVIAKDGDCYCEPIVDSSDRNDPRSEHMPSDDVICYEAKPGESIVGICYQSGGEYVCQPNENAPGFESTSNGRCAENKPNCCDQVDCSSC